MLHSRTHTPSPPCSCGIRLALKFPDRKVQVINFGCPKVGNAAFAKLVNTTTNLCVQRVAHKRDIITRGPNLDFNHVGHTIQIDEALDVKPRAHKWHAGLHAMTNWNLIGWVGSRPPHSCKLQGGEGVGTRVHHAAVIMLCREHRELRSH